jgi:hypothetical protein
LLIGYVFFVVPKAIWRLFVGDVLMDVPKDFNDLALTLLPW